MSITILNYHDHALIEQVNQRAAQRAEEARAAEEAAAASEDFAAVLGDAVSVSYSSPAQTSVSAECPSDLYPIFEEAASTYGVSVNLLTSIAKAESGFQTNAVSSAGAVGIMQLMPATAASLGVSNSYDARENIMGGAKYIAQLLNKYNGDTSLALAAYNAGSSNVDQYGGIPPFTETQNYVQKVLSYLNEDTTASAVTAADASADLTDTLSNLIASRNITADTIDAMVELLQSLKTVVAETASDTAMPADAQTALVSEAAAPSLTVTVLNGTDNL